MTFPQDPTPAPPANRGLLRACVWTLVIVLTAYVGFGSLTLYAWRYEMTSPVTVPSLDIGFGSVDGREIAVVPYGSNAPEGLLGVPAWLVGDTVVGVAALDLDAREELWRTELFSGHPQPQAGVVGVGAELAYVATDDGLVVLDVRTGAVVARPDGIDGLGADYLASRTAYAHDPGARAVITLNARGDVLAIPLDATAARPAGEPAVLRWRDTLNLDDERRPLAAHESADVPEEIPLPSAPGLRVLIDDSLRSATVTVADAGSGRAEHTGRFDDAVRAAVVSATGRVVVLTAKEVDGVLVGALAVADADGVHALPVGDVGFVGW